MVANWNGLEKAEGSEGRGMTGGLQKGVGGSVIDCPAKGIKDGVPPSHVDDCRGDLRMV